VIRSCLRQHHYRYNLGLQLDANDRMRFGTVGHKALEAWYRAWMDGYTTARLDAALDAITGLSHVDTIKLRVLATAYHHRWGAEDWEVLAVEVEFRFMLGDRLIGGKIDAIIRDRKDGRVWVIEHKTTGSDTSIGGVYWERLTLDSQVSIYIDGAAILGYQVSGCIYDVLKRPAHEVLQATPAESRKYTQGKGCKACGGSAGGKVGILRGRGHAITQMPDGTQHCPNCHECGGTGWKEEPKLYANQRPEDETPGEFETRLIEAIAENPDSFLQRGTVVRLEHELPAMRQDVCDDIDRVETGLIPRNPDACVRGGEMCGYWGLCNGTVSADTFTSGPAHPELDAAT